MSLSGTRATEIDVFAVPEPEWTETWHPIKHSRCIDVLNTTVQLHNLNVVKREYSLSKDKTKMFGSWAIKSNEDIAQTIVFRNSLNKEFAFGIAAGTHAFVCDNLAFSGEFVEFRKHTKGMNDSELERVVANGFEIILPRMEKFQQWHLALHEVRLIPAKMKELCYDALVEGILPKTKVEKFNTLLFGGKEVESAYNSRELFGFHGANTQLIRDTRMTTSGYRQEQLHRFIENRYGKLLPLMN